MKYSIALLALLGLVSFEQTNALEVRNSANIRHLAYESESESESESGSDSEDDIVNVQLTGDADVDHSDEFFAAGDQGMTPNGVEYVRTFPDQYSEESENKFMRGILENYALEKKNTKGEPTGVFRMDRKQTMAASKEVVSKHKGMQGKDLDNFVKQYFGRTWEHFDVNQEGMLDALDMPAFMKYLCSD